MNHIRQGFLTLTPRAVLEAVGKEGKGHRLCPRLIDPIEGLRDQEAFCPPSFLLDALREQGDQRIDTARVG